MLRFWNFRANRSQTQMLYFCVCHVCTKRSQIQRWSTHQIVLVLKLFVISPNLKIILIVIVIIWLCYTHSYCCFFTKNLTWCTPMRSIPMSSDSCSMSTEETAFIQCIDGLKPQIRDSNNLSSTLGSKLSWIFLVNFLTYNFGKLWGI